ncbi:MAG TPA: hypothetical protein VKO18_21615 [Terriglobia bacterium]|nr:hypothetical protein [Terriglobia bacterium]
MAKCLTAEAFPGDPLAVNAWFKGRGGTMNPRELDTAILGSTAAGSGQGDREVGIARRSVNR